MKQRIGAVLRGCLLIILLGGYAHSVYGREKYLYPTTSTIIRATDHAAQLMLYSATLTSLFTICRSTPVSNFGLPRKITIARNAKINYYSTKSYFLLIILIIILLNISFYFSVFGWTYYKYYLLRDILFAIFCIIFRYIILFLTNLANLFIDLNNLLISASENQLKNFPYTARGNYITFHNAKHLKTIRYLATKYGKLCEYVETFNIIFGPLIIFSVLHFICGMVFCVSIITEYSIRGHKAVGHDIRNWILGVYGAWFVTFAVSNLRNNKKFSCVNVGGNVK